MTFYHKRPPVLKYLRPEAKSVEKKIQPKKVKPKLLQHAYIILGTIDCDMCAQVCTSNNLLTDRRSDGKEGYHKSFDQILGTITLKDMGHMEKDITLSLMRILSPETVRGRSDYLKEYHDHRNNPIERMLEIEIVKCLGL